MDRGLLVTQIGPNGNIRTKRVWSTQTPTVITTMLLGRKTLRIKNMNDHDVHVGLDESVTTGDGYPIFAQSYEDFNFGPEIEPYIMQSAAGSGDIRILEAE